MTEITQYDNPNDIHSLSRLKIQAVSENRSPQIYANGRNQLPIQITVKALNKEGNALKFSNETWLSILNLCCAQSDKKLSRNGNSGWCFTEVENEYSKEILSGSHRSKRFLIGEDGTAFIILYVYTYDVNTKRIAVSVDIPYSYNKHYTTADIASGAETMSLTVTALSKINYNNRENIAISVGDFMNTSNTLGWTKRDVETTTKDNNGEYTKLSEVPHYNGYCKRRIVKIRSLYHGDFKECKITYEKITNDEVNQGSIKWKGISEEKCFDALQNDGSYSYPCAVIGNGFSYSHYHVNFWFRCKSIYVDGQVYVYRNLSFSRFWPWVKENHTDDDYSEGTLLLYKFVVPVQDFTQYSWHDVIRNPTVNVTDIYGNTGTFQLVFNDTEHFNTPGIA